MDRRSLTECMQMARQSRQRRVSVAPLEDGEFHLSFLLVKVITPVLSIHCSVSVEPSLSHRRARVTFSWEWSTRSSCCKTRCPSMCDSMYALYSKECKIRHTRNRKHRSQKVKELFGLLVHLYLVHIVRPLLNLFVPGFYKWVRVVYIQKYILYLAKIGVTNFTIFWRGRKTLKNRGRHLQPPGPPSLEFQPASTSSYLGRNFPKK